MAEILCVLCKSNGWSYGVCWKFDVRNPRLLVMSGSFYEEQIGIAIDRTIPQVHLVGEGTIGVAAVSGKHQWLYVDTCYEGNSEWQHQFLAGIKTVAIISLPSFGVVQFGSMEKVSENIEFINQVQRFLCQREDIMSNALPRQAYKTLCQNYASAQTINSFNNVESSTSSILSSNCFPWGLQCVSTSHRSQFTKIPSVNSISSLQLTNPLPSGIYMQPSYSYPSSSFATNSWTKEFSNNNNVPYCFGNSISSSSSKSSSIASEAPDNLLSFPQESAPENSISFRFSDDSRNDLTDQYVQPSNIESQTLSCNMPPSLPSKPNEISLTTSMSMLDATCEPTQVLDNDLFEGMELDFSPRILNYDSWDDIILPLSSSNCSNLSTSVSNCISDKGLFSGSSFEQLLESVMGENANLLHSHNSTPINSGPLNIDNQVSSTSRNSKIAPLAEFSLEKIIQQSSMHNESGVKNKTKKSEENSKGVRKRARPGESTRPRPKDRQQIQDRVKELREIVPNSAKCSIDSLLDRTIKHMLFLQSVTKYADKLKQTDEPKMIGNENGVVLKDSSSGSGGGGATWAYEVAGQTMVCPILVEDLNPPGQMLVEMLCEERGFFLEIADVIRGFGLTILKGVMEIRDHKVWARFLVEANREVTRMDIFLSLVQLLQQTSTIRAGEQQNKALDSFTNYQQPQVQTPIRLQ